MQCAEGHTVCIQETPGARSCQDAPAAHLPAFPFHALTRIPRARLHVQEPRPSTPAHPPYVRPFHPATCLCRTFQSCSSRQFLRAAIDECVRPGRTHVFSAGRQHPTGRCAARTPCEDGHKRNQSPRGPRRRPHLHATGTPRTSRPPTQTPTEPARHRHVCGKHSCVAGLVPSHGVQSARRRPERAAAPRTLPVPARAVCRTLLVPVARCPCPCAACAARCQAASGPTLRCLCARESWAKMGPFTPY